MGDLNMHLLDYYLITQQAVEAQDKTKSKSV